jgi:hypothetical protein
MAPQLTSIPVLSRRALLTLDDLAWAIDRDGIAAHEAAVSQIVAVAADHGVRPVLVAVLRNDALPASVRERAFGLLALALARSVGTIGTSYAHAA